MTRPARITMVDDSATARDTFATYLGVGPATEAGPSARPAD